jgi:hypothetical protein
MKAKLNKKKIIFFIVSKIEKLKNKCSNSRFQIPDSKFQIPDSKFQISRL